MSRQERGRLAVRAHLIPWLPCGSSGWIEREIIVLNPVLLFSISIEVVVEVEVKPGSRLIRYGSRRERNVVDRCLNVMK